MNNIIILMILVGLGYYLYSHTSNPSLIENPSFAEARVELKIQERELTMVLMAKMVDMSDCAQRGQNFWRKTLEDCDTCEFIDYQCKNELSDKYQALFDNRTTYTTYVVAERGSRFERDARMIVWGLNNIESISFCEYITNAMKKKYTGQVRCIEGTIN